METKHSDLSKEVQVKKNAIFKLTEIIFNEFISSKNQFEEGEKVFNIYIILSH